MLTWTVVKLWFKTTKELRAKNRKLSGENRESNSLIDELRNRIQGLEGKIESTAIIRRDETSARDEEGQGLEKKVRELEETIEVQLIAIEQLTAVTGRDRERVRAETAIHVMRRKAATEGTNHADIETDSPEQ